MQVKEIVRMLGTALLDFLATLALGFRSKWTRWRGRGGERLQVRGGVWIYGGATHKEMERESEWAFF